MRKLFAVIRREFMVRVHTRAFVIGTVLGPTLMAFLFVFPMLLESRDRAPKRVVVLDAASGEFGARVTDALAGARRGVGPDAAPRYVVTQAGGGRRECRAAGFARLVDRGQGRRPRGAGRRGARGRFGHRNGTPALLREQRRQPLRNGGAPADRPPGGHRRATGPRWRGSGRAHGRHRARVARDRQGEQRPGKRGDGRVLLHPRVRHVVPAVHGAAAVRDAGHGVGRRGKEQPDHGSARVQPDALRADARQGGRRRVRGAAPARHLERGGQAPHLAAGGHRRAASAPRPRTPSACRSPPSAAACWWCT